jgi:hypothetical protein
MEGTPFMMVREVVVRKESDGEGVQVSVCTCIEERILCEKGLGNHYGNQKSPESRENRGL